MHQVVAYLSGAIVIGFAVHAPSADSAVLLAGAVLVLALGVLAKGPIGALRVLGRRTLRVAEVVVAALLAVLPFFQSGGPRLEVVVILWVVAVALLRLAFFRVGSVAQPDNPPVAAGPSPGAAPSALDLAVRQAGRRTGDAGRRVRQVTDKAQPAVLRGARALGRVAGRRQAGRRGEGPGGDGSA